MAIEERLLFWYRCSLPLRETRKNEVLFLKRQFSNRHKKAKRDHFLLFAILRVHQLGTVEAETACFASAF